VGCVRGTFGGDEKGVQNFGGETWRKGAARRFKGRLQKKILKEILKKY